MTHIKDARSIRARCARKVLVTLIAAATVSIGALAGAPAAQAASTQQEVSVQTVSCSVGSFKGEARIAIGHNGADTWSNNFRWTIDVLEARLTSPFALPTGRVVAHSDQWRNGLAVPNGPTAEHRNFRTDGNWHPVDATTDHAVSLPATSKLRASVAFQFDAVTSPGIQCGAGVDIAAGPRVADKVATAHATGMHDRIAYCKADAGGTCTINETKTVSSTITVQAGLSYEWLSAQLSKSWTNERSVSISCNSRPLAADERYEAYPVGTKYDFTTYNEFAGTRLSPKPSTAFEVDGGIACMVRS